MTKAVADSKLPSPLSNLLAGRPAWTLQQRLVLASRLARAIQALHRQGVIHRAIDAAAVTVDAQFQPQLAPPAGPRQFGGEQSDPEFCPGELAQGPAVELPAAIEAAGAILRQQTVGVDPRRIDVYQLGVVLCQLLTGEALLSYRYSPTVKAKVPPAARDLLARCLGEGPVEPWTDCDGPIAALDQLIRDLADLPEEAASAAQDAADAADSQPTAGAEELPHEPGPQPGEVPLPELEGLVGPERPWRRLWNRAARLLRRNVPEFLQEFQSASQQVDAAVADCQRRCARIGELLRESRDMVAELTGQIAHSEEAARPVEAEADAAPDPESLWAKQQACQEHLAVLRAQYDERHHRIWQLEAELVRAETTLAQLRSQRDLLNERLKAAWARQQIEGVAPQPGFWRLRRSLQVIAGAVVVALSLVTLLALLALGRFQPAAIGVPEVVSVEPVVPPPQAAPASSLAGLTETQAMIASLDPQRFGRVTIAGGDFADLTEGARLTKSASQAWTRIPPYLKNMVFFQSNNNSGHIPFSVERSGIVLLAVTSRWGGGGRASGEWTKTLTSRAKFLADGWREVGRLERTPAEPHDWLLFWRDCKAGESFDLRTEKYQAPILILPKGTGIDMVK